MTCAGHEESHLAFSIAETGAGAIGDLRLGPGELAKCGLYSHPIKMCQCLVFTNEQHRR
jgi:hypothetical protein